MLLIKGMNCSFQTQPVIRQGWPFVTLQVLVWLGQASEEQQEVQEVQKK